MKEEKTKQAVALSYNPGDEAPFIVAAGKGALAESDVPLYEDSKLANTLSKLDIGDSIPPELYSVVAQILVFVDNLDKLKGKFDGK